MDTPSINVLRVREREAREALARCAGERATLAEGLVAALKERDSLRNALMKIRTMQGDPIQIAREAMEP